MVIFNLKYARNQNIKCRRPIDPPASAHDEDVNPYNIFNIENDLVNVNILIIFQFIGCI